MPATSECRVCRTPRATRPGDGGVCGACELTTFPAISERHGRWSPLALGGLSLFCDVFLIPTFFAIGRGFQDLREVARREAAGYWHREHPSVRAGAVWGILLGLARPGLGLLVVLTMLFVVGAEPRPGGATVPELSGDELTEILARVYDRDPETRHTALRHLAEVAPLTEGIARGQLFDALRRPTDLTPAEARESRGAIAAALVTSLPATYDPVADITRLALAAESLDRRGRAAIVDAAARHESADAMEAITRVMRLDDPPALPVQALSARGAVLGDVLPELLAREPESPVRRDALRVAAAVCQGAHRPDLRAARSDLSLDWVRAYAALRGEADPGDLSGWLEPAREARVAYALDALAAMGCLSADEATVGLLDEAQRDMGDPRVALTAAMARASLEPCDDSLTRGCGPGPSAALRRRAAADPRSRRTLHDFLARHDALDTLPAATWSGRALAESDLFAWLVAEGLRPDAVTHELLQSRTVDRELREVHVFVLADGAGEHRVAVGPYPSAHPSVVAAGPARDASWGALSAAQLVDELLSRWEAGE